MTLKINNEFWKQIRVLIWFLEFKYHFSLIQLNSIEIKNFLEELNIENNYSSEF